MRKAGKGSESSPGQQHIDTQQHGLRLGWSEKHKSWKMQKARADSKSRHTTDFRTVFEIMIGRFVSCEIGQTYFTESGVRFGTLERPDFRSFS